MDQERDIEVQARIDALLEIYEALVIADVNGETVDLYMETTKLISAATELKKSVERVMFG